MTTDTGAAQTFDHIAKAIGLGYRITIEPHSLPDGSDGCEIRAKLGDDEYGKACAIDGQQIKTVLFNLPTCWGRQYGNRGE